MTVTTDRRKWLYALKHAWDFLLVSLNLQKCRGSLHSLGRLLTDFLHRTCRSARRTWDRRYQANLDPNATFAKVCFKGTVYQVIPSRPSASATLRLAQSRDR